MRPPWFKARGPHYLKIRPPSPGGHHLHFDVFLEGTAVIFGSTLALFPHAPVPPVQDTLALIERDKSRVRASVIASDRGMSVTIEVEGTGNKFEIEFIDSDDKCQNWSVVK
jgi:hypothetical protein